MSSDATGESWITCDLVFFFFFFCAPAKWVGIQGSTYMWEGSPHMWDPNICGERDGYVKVAMMLPSRY